jgi:CubicO group peptidase (beta-lactamase class C family)
MTKPILATALMILYEEGSFQLSDPLSRFIPAFKHVQVIQKSSADGLELVPLEREITLHDLLTQTAGVFYDYLGSPQVAKMLEEIAPTHPDTNLEECTHRLAQLPLNHQPGKGWRYGEGSEVLGRVVELISGMPLDVFFQERIFGPLGMVDTHYGIRENDRDRTARLYGLSEAGSLVEKVEFAPWLIPSSTPRGGFGLISSASDYLRFCQMLLNKGELDGKRILGRKTVEYMTRNHLPAELIPIAVFGTPFPGYGYGFLMGVMVDAVQAGMLGSEGEYYWGGLSTLFWIDPQEELIGLLLTRTEYPNHAPAYCQFRTLVYQALIE